MVGFHPEYDESQHEIEEKAYNRECYNSWSWAVRIYFSLSVEVCGYGVGQIMIKPQHQQYVQGDHHPSNPDYALIHFRRINFYFGITTGHGFICHILLFSYQEPMEGLRNKLTLAKLLIRDDAVNDLGLVVLNS